jgi:hypothetical protein
MAVAVAAVAFEPARNAARHDVCRSAQYVAAATLLAIVAVLACEVPALRAMRVDPAWVLRADG